MAKKRWRFLSYGFAVVQFVAVWGLLGAPGAVALAETGKTSYREVDQGTIKVTAQKQEENSQDVPLSLTLMNQVDIEDRRIDTLFDMANYVPNLLIFQQGSSGFNVPTMRGISTTAESFSVPVGLYVDGVPILNPNGFEEEFVDIERIEVLRGPQGTCYGKGAEAGVISIITRQPGNEFRGKVSTEVGRSLSGEGDDAYKKSVNLSLSGPISKDKLSFGLAGKYYEKDGFIENSLTGDAANDREHWYARGQLRWTPTDRVDVSLWASHLEKDDDGYQMNLGKNGVATFNMVLKPFYGVELPDSEYRKVASNMKGALRNWETDMQCLKVACDISDRLTLTSVTTNWKYKRRDNGDYDFNAIVLQHNDSTIEFNKKSEELRLNYMSDGIKWLAGLYCDTDDSSVEVETVTDFPVFAANPIDRELEGDTYAAFANVTWPLTGRLNLNAGLRYEYEDKDFEDKLIAVKRDESWDEFSPKLALDYRVTPEIMTFASVSKGYRSGGFNSTAKDEKYFSYDPEVLWSYEVGVKSGFLNNRVLANASAFYMDISDMQVKQVVEANRSYLTNAAEATGKGCELEISAMVANGLSLMAGFGYTDIEFDTFKDEEGDHEGNKNPYAPEYTYNVGAQYRHTGGFYARADLIGYGKMYFDKANEFSRDPYEVVNAKVGYETEHVDVYLYGQNILDKEYDSEGFYGGFYTVYSEPGEVGVQLACRF